MVSATRGRVASGYLPVSRRPVRGSLCGPMGLEPLETRVLLAVVTVDTVAELVAAVSNGAAGDTVNIAAGTYELTAKLSPKANMTIQGAGMGQTILTAASSWSPSTAALPDTGLDSNENDRSAFLFDLSINDSVTICDMTLDGDDRLHGGVFGFYNDNIEFSGIRFQDFLWCGLRTYATNGAAIHDNEFINTGGRWKTGGVPGTDGGITGGAVYATWLSNAEIWNNRIYRTNMAPEREFYGIKGRQATHTRIHNNSIEVNFSIELPFESDAYVEIDHNYLKGTVSIPKDMGGPVPSGGYTFHIHHNYFRSPYSLEFPRNGVEIDHNLFDFATTSDWGNLISGFASTTAGGPTLFHDNLIKNPGRGVFWSQGVCNNLSFYNNHIIANTTVTPRTEGLFGFNTGTDFSTITIKDNIIECVGQARPLVRNSASYAANIENNTLTNVSDSTNYANPATSATRGVIGDLIFNVGAYEQYAVNNWVISENGVGDGNEAAFVRGGTYADANYGADGSLLVKNGTGTEWDRVSYIKLNLADLNAADTFKLKLYGSGSAAMSVTAHAANTATWNQDTLTWNNQPGYNATALDTKSIGTPVGWYEWDITSYVRDRLNAGQAVGAVALWTTTWDVTATFNSDDSATNPPQLVAEPGTPSGVVALEPLADAFIRGGIYASTNYGSDTALMVKEDSGSDYDRRALYRFDLSGYSTPVTSAMLKLPVVSGGTDTAGMVVEVRKIENDGWAETGVNWSNAPTAGSLLATIPASSITIGGTVTVDLTGAINTEIAGDKVLSLLLVPTTSGSQRQAAFGSREQSQAANRSRLEISINPTTVTAAHDAYVRGGTYANANYGSDATLQVKEDSGSDYDRMSFLQFDLTGYSSSISLANLVLPVVSGGPDLAGMTLEVRLVTSDSWTESTLTWNTKPATSTVLATINGSSMVVGGAVTVDLTSVVNDAIAGDKTLSIALVAVNAGGSQRFVNFGSSEQLDPSLRTHLEIL